MQSRGPVLIVCVLCVVLAACVTGPRAFKASHALHNEALRMRIDEELLLNVVRLRYRDSPLFLQVGSVVTQFGVNASAAASGSLQEGGPDSLGIDAGVGWSEQPTYTFTPLQDNDFVRRLLTPIDLELIVLLQRSGWSIERVLRLTVQNLGGLDNAASASGPTPVQAPEFSDFLRLTRIMRALQQQGRLQLALENRTVALSSPIAASSVLAADLVSAAENGYRFDPADGAPSQRVLTREETTPVLEVLPAAGDDDALQEFLRLLRLLPGRSRYDVIVGAWTPSAGPGDRNTSVGVSTRSLLGAFFYLSQGIDIPRAHLDAGLVTVTQDGSGGVFDWQQLSGGLFTVRSSASKPERAAIAVPYRNYWFYIDDQDLDSKSTFALLLELFNMSAEAADTIAPTLTLPVG